MLNPVFTVAIALQGGRSRGASTRGELGRRLNEVAGSWLRSPNRRNAALTTALVLLVFVASPCLADEPALIVTFGAVTKHYSASDLLARPDAADVAIPDDPVYRRTQVYRAVPLPALLAEIPSGQFDTVEMRATDGFVAQVPLALVRPDSPGDAVPWIAVEPPGQPWSMPPGTTVGAGPFSVVWQHPERSGVTSEQWAYALASMTAVASPARRWPQLAVAATLPGDAPARRGQAVFTGFCLPCHRMKGGGAAEVGPDLGNATSYLTEPGLRALVRDPKAVRTWPFQHMQGFDTHKLPEADLDALIAYLRAMDDAGAPLR